MQLIKNLNQTIKSLQQIVLTFIRLDRETYSVIFCLKVNVIIKPIINDYVRTNDDNTVCTYFILVFLNTVEYKFFFCRQQTINYKIIILIKVFFLMYTNCFENLYFFKKKLNVNISSITNKLNILISG